MWGKSETDQKKRKHIHVKTYYGEEGEDAANEEKGPTGTGPGRGLLESKTQIFGGGFLKKSNAQARKSPGGD